jgi:hypothetical protein
VGQTWRSLKVRFRYKKNQPYIYNAINKYGKDSFYYEVLTVCHTQETANYWEAYFEEKYDTCNPQKGWNLRKGGGAKGAHSPTSKSKMSVAKKGIPLKEDHKENISKANIGELNGAAKLTEKQAMQIYQEFLNDPTLIIKNVAKQYVVTPACISYILNKKAWKKATAHLPKITIGSAQGIKFNRSGLTELQVKDIKNQYPQKLNIKELASKYQVSYMTVYDIVKGHTWKHIK